MSAAADKFHDFLHRLKWKDVSPQDFSEAIAEAFKAQLVPLAARIRALEEEAGEKRWCGVYSTTQSYKKHNSVTHGGSLWYAVEDPSGSPPGHGWELQVKRGKDAQ